MQFLDPFPRAVAPSAALRDAVQPELSNFLHSTDSPHPYGIGVYMKDKATGTENAQPLYYVSHSVAEARGRGVREGWYIVARPGAMFSLRVTRVTGSDELIESGALGHVVEVIVDGVNVGGNRCFCHLPAALAEKRLCGFIKSKSKDELNAELQLFQFQRSEISESSTMATVSDPVESPGAGCIQMRMYSGPLVRKSINGAQRQKNNLSTMPSVSEKKALKQGLSVCVARDGNVVKVNYAPSKIVHYVKFGGTFDAIVNVYFREQFWLESRCIIDKNGNPWAPKTNGPVVEVVDEVVDEPEAVVEGENDSSDKKGKRGVEGEAENKAKRVKKELINLTLVKDSIDLTVINDHIDLDDNSENVELT